MILFEGTPTVVKLYNYLYYEFGVNKWWFTLFVFDWLTVNYNADLILILMWTISLLNSIWFKRLSRALVILQIIMPWKCIKCIKKVRFQENSFVTYDSFKIFVYRNEYYTMQ